MLDESAAGVRFASIIALIVPISFIIIFMTLVLNAACKLFPSSLAFRHPDLPDVSDVSIRWPTRSLFLPFCRYSSVDLHRLLYVQRKPANALI